MNTKSPHFWWIISLLSSTIIALIAFVLTQRTADASLIIEYISYASILLSITLSVFAILYTYTSNVQIQRQFEKINSAATSIHSTSKDLISTSRKLNDSLESIMEHLKNIDQHQREMHIQLDSMNNPPIEITKLSNQKN